MKYDNWEPDNIRYQLNQYGSNLSLWGAGGIIDKVYYPANNDEMLCVVNNCEDYYIIGKGSNLLISDKGYKGVVISTTLLNNLEGECTLYCGAGVSMARLLNATVDRQLSGLEELSGIPCSIGGAVVGNAGAFGREISELIQFVDVCYGKEIERIDAKDIQFGYRDSSLRKSIIVAIGLQLVESSKDLIENKIKEYRLRRSKSQPKERSLGSVFKAYKGKPAALYIEELNIKGYTIGDAMISPVHCNFIVNKGKATTNDYIELVKFIQDRVYNEFDIVLDTEIAYLGAINEDLR